MNPFDKVRITKCTKPEYVGFEGELHTNLKSFHANAGNFSMIDILMISDNEPCIGIIGDNGAFWWTKNSDFDVEVSLV